MIFENLRRTLAAVKTMPDQMTAVRLHAFGGPEALEVERVPVPHPARGEVVVQIRAAAVNHLDLDIREGRSRLPIRFPHVLGMEAAGAVAEIGADVDGVTVGDRVAVLYQSRCGSCAYCTSGEHSLCPQAELIGVHRPGAYAEHLVAREESLVLLPPHVTFADAAAMQLSFGTAWHALVGRGRLRAGETVLVSAAGSGVGSAALQVAKHQGAHVIASVGTPDKARSARELGIRLVVDYSSEPLAETVRAATGGVDVVLEHVGGEVFGESLRCLRPGGRVVVVGAHAGEEVPLDLVTLFRNQWSVIGSRRATEPELRHVYSMLSDGALQPVIDSTLPLERVAEAHKRLSERRQFGKIILLP